MHQLLPRLWLGGLTDLPADLATASLEAFPPTAIVNVSQFPPQPAGPRVQVWMPLVDEVFLPSATWDAGVRTLDFLLKERYTVLVHCRLGKSRSVTLCAAYLVSQWWPAEQALARIRQCRPEAAPHPETWRSMLAWAAGHP